MGRTAMARFQPKSSRNLAATVALVVLNAACIAGPPASTAGETSGRETCTTVLRPLVIQVEFPGTRRHISTAGVREKFLDQLDRYVREMSYEKVCIRGEVTPRWYPLPNPITSYWVPWQNLRVDKSNVRRLVRDSLDAVDRDVDISTYDFVIIALAATFKEWGNSGIAVYPGMLGWTSDESLFASSGRKVQRGIVAYASTAAPGQVFHDVAHVLAGVRNGRRVLPCLYDQDMEGVATARDPAAVTEAFRATQIHMGGWDTMSCNSCLHLPGPPGISAWTKLRLGWLEPSKVRVVRPGEDVQVLLGPLEDAASSVMAIKIPLTPTTYYLVENRQPIGYDKNLAATGVLIMYADDRIGESRHGFGPVRLVNADPTVPHLEGAAFDVDKNASFADEGHGVRIRLLRKSGKSYEVLVERTRR